MKRKDQLLQSEPGVADSFLLVDATLGPTKP